MESFIDLANLVEQDDLNRGLIDAVNNRDLDRMKQLIKLGADVNSKDHRNRSALHLSIYYYPIDTKAPYNKDIVMLLLNNGADVNIKSSYGNTALMSAIEFKRLDIVIELLHRNVDVNAITNFGSTALHTATSYYKQYNENECVISCVMVELLLAKGADVNAKDYEGKTPLRNAASKGHIELVKMLINAGADVNIMSIKGRTALHKAMNPYMKYQNENIEVIKLLLENGANTLIIDKDGNTPIMLAYKYNKMKVLELIIKSL